MDRLITLPMRAAQALRDQGVALHELLLAAETDRLSQGGYAQSYIVLTERTLYRLTGPQGDFNPQHPHPSAWELDELCAYELSQCGKLIIEPLASGNRLLLIFDGREVALCCYSSRHIAVMAKFVELFNMRVEGREWSKEDFALDIRKPSCPKCGMLYPEEGREVCPRCLDKRSIFRRVLSFATRYKASITLLVALMVANAALQLVTPYLVGRVFYDQVLTPGGLYRNRLIEVIALIFLAKALSSATAILYGRLNSGLSSRVVYDLKTHIFRSMQALSMSFFNRQQTGRLIKRVQEDATDLEYFFHDGIPYFIVNVLMIAGVVAIMFFTAPILALAVLIPVPLIFIAMYRVFPRLYALWARLWRRSAAVNSMLNDTLMGTRVVKAFGRGRDESQRFEKLSGRYLQAQASFDLMVQTVFPILGTAISACMFIVLLVGGWQVLDGAISFGTLMLFIELLNMLYGPMDFFANVTHWWTHCMNAAQRMFEVMDAKPDVVESLHPMAMEAMEGYIQLERVTFAYEPGKPVIHDVSFEAKPGEMLGIVGHSGAGKSTLISLIARLYDVNQGSIHIDGIDLRDIRLEDIHRQIGVVSQETFIFIGTVAENIALAKPEASREEIIAAARTAGAHDFIAKLPEGYDSMIGTGGRELSGGERQRLSIARAIVHNPRILILDEATSSVDTATEKRIQQALEKLVVGRTTLSIAHRLSTLRNAHHLVVMSEGKLVETGTHQQLISQKGVYYDLWKKQSQALQFKGVQDE